MIERINNGLTYAIKTVLIACVLVYGAIAVCRGADIATRAENVSAAKYEAQRIEATIPESALMTDRARILRKIVSKGGKYAPEARQSPRTIGEIIDREEKARKNGAKK